MESASDEPAVNAADRRLVFWAAAAVVILADMATKALAVSSLVLGVPRGVWGQSLRLALVYNPGAAFGFSFGPSSRQIFVALTIAALAVLVRLYRTTRPSDTLRMMAIGLVAGGAIGNLVDRLRSPAGVVDFIDVGLRHSAGRRSTWPTWPSPPVRACSRGCCGWMIARAKQWRARPRM